MMVVELPNTKKNSKNNKIIKWLNGKCYKSSTILEFSTTPQDYFEVYFEVLEVARKNNSSDDGIKILYQSDQNVQECLSKASVTWFENGGTLSEKYKITLKKSSIANNLTPIFSNKGIEFVHPTESNAIGWWNDHNINPENMIPQDTNEDSPPVDDNENYYENIHNLILERSGNRRRNIRVRVNHSTQDLPYFNRPQGFHEMYFQTMWNQLYAQGDTQEMDRYERIAREECVSTRDNVVVSVLFSPYTKLMAVVLVFNTLFLLKLVLWSTIQEFFL